MRAFRISAACAVLLAVVVESAYARGPEEDAAKMMAVLKDKAAPEAAHLTAQKNLTTLLNQEPILIPLAIDLLADPVAAKYVIVVLDGTKNVPLRQVVPALLKLLSDPANREMRAILLKSLVKYEVPNKDLLPALIAVLGDEDAAGKQQALELIGSMKEEGAPALAALLMIVQKNKGAAQAEQVQLVVTAVKALGAIGPAANEAAPVLQELAKNPQPPIVAAAQEALPRLKNGAPDKPMEKSKVVTAEQAQELMTALKDPAKRKEAILTLANGGVAGRAAEPALVELLRDPDREVRLLAAYALDKLETAK